MVRQSDKKTLSSTDAAAGGAPIAGLVVELQAAVVTALGEALAGSDLSDIRPTHCRILRRIEPEGSRLTDLAGASHMTKQSMGALVDHLEASGYVERVADRADARVKAIRLTPRGRRAAKAIGEIGGRLEAEWAQKIGRRRLEQLRAAMLDITR